MAVDGAGVIGMAAIIEFMPQPHTSNICITPTPANITRRRECTRVTATLNHARRRAASGEYPMGLPPNTIEYARLPVHAFKVALEPVVALYGASLQKPYASLASCRVTRRFASKADGAGDPLMPSY